MRGNKTPSRWHDVILEGSIFLLAFWAGVLLYHRTRALDHLLAYAPPVNLSMLTTPPIKEDPFFLFVTSPHMCSVDVRSWDALINLVRKHKIPVYGWIVARPELPETSLWLRSMNFPFPVQTVSPSRILPLLEGMLGGNPWTHLPALILVYHGKALAIQSFSSINLEGIHWLERYLQNRERFPWFY